MKRSEVYDFIDSEIDYAAKWDKLPRSERPLRDAEKPVEFWLVMMDNYLSAAKQACYDTDKTEALDAIRKIAALCVRCMMHNEPPPRTES